MRESITKTQAIKWNECPPIKIELERNKKRPSVLYIVVDALRGQSYNTIDNSEDLPGLEFLKENFVEYTNAWSTYNATAGAMPAMLNGIKHPIWYKVSKAQSESVRNITSMIAESCDYRIFNTANYMGV